MSGNTFSSSRWLIASRNYPGRLWSLHLWKYSQPSWTWCWETSSRWPFLSSKAGQMIPRGSLQPQLLCVILHDSRVRLPGWAQIVLLGETWSNSVTQSKEDGVCEVAPHPSFGQCLKLDTTFQLIYPKFMHEIILFFNEHFPSQDRVLQKACHFHHFHLILHFIFLIISNLFLCTYQLAKRNADK